MRSSAVIRLTLALTSMTVVLTTSGCATTGGRGAAELTRDEKGFTITEDVNASLGVRGDFRRAVELLEAGDHEGGIELLEKVVEAEPEITSAQIDLGIAYRLTDQLEKAEASLSHALEINPRHPAALTELGLVYRRMGRFDDARKSYEKALQYHPDFHFARRNLAILCDLYLGDLPCAVEHYELYLQMVPHDEQASIWLADLRNRLGIPQPAQKIAAPAPTEIQVEPQEEVVETEGATEVIVEEESPEPAPEAGVVVEEESVEAESATEANVVEGADEAHAEAGSEVDESPPAEAAIEGATE